MYYTDENTERRERARALHGRQTRVVCQIGKALALLMLGIHSAQYKNAVAPFHHFAILTHTAYCCPHLHCLLDFLFVCLVDCFLSFALLLLLHRNSHTETANRRNKPTTSANLSSSSFLLASFLQGILKP